MIALGNLAHEENNMAVEAKRGCGYRKVGGLYMVSGQLSAPCGRLPLEVHICPTCKGGIKQTRGWTWVDAGALLANAAACRVDESMRYQLEYEQCTHCPASRNNLEKLTHAGLVWVGGSFYPEAEDFMREARAMGVSRRIPAIPRGFRLGETWLLIGHPKAVSLSPTDPRVTDEEREELRLANVKLAEAGEPQRYAIARKGIITMFKPTAIEKIVTQTQSTDAAAMEELAKKGITPVIVPDDDKDHQGSVHDNGEQETPRHFSDDELHHEREPKMDPQTGFFEEAGL
jgi:hypothetical protein